MREYVLIQSEKKNYGFNGLEGMDLLLLLIGVFLLIFFFLVIGNFTFTLSFAIIYTFCLLPINVSNKNRMYKIIIMMVLYALNTHILIYESEKKEGVLNEYSQKFKQIKNSITEKINNDNE